MNALAHAATAPTVVIRPPSRWRAVPLRELWHYRDLLLVLARREITLRYRQTALGVVWVLMQPLAAAAIFTAIFSRVANLTTDGIPYFLFAYAGFLGWNAFQGTLTRAASSLVQNSQLVSKVYFPRLVLPLSTILLTLVDFAVGLGLFAVVAPFKGIGLHAGMLLLPAWLAAILLLAVGIGMYLAALMVRYRDVQHALPVVMQFALYASPVGYALSAVPPGLRRWFVLNPMTGLLEGFRWSLVGGVVPPAGRVLYSLAFVAASLVLGAIAFRRMEREFADVI
jgi:lipopolysaccharide transport system permease protein